MNNRSIVHFLRTCLSGPYQDFLIAISSSSHYLFQCSSRFSSDVFLKICHQSFHDHALPHTLRRLHLGLFHIKITTCISSKIHTCLLFYFLLRFTTFYFVSAIITGLSDLNFWKKDSQIEFSYNHKSNYHSYEWYVNVTKSLLNHWKCTKGNSYFFLDINHCSVHNIILFIGCFNNVAMLW